VSSIALVVMMSLAAAEPAPVSSEASGASEASECDCEAFGRTGALSVLAGGLVLGVTSLLAFNTGFEAERQLRSGEARGVDEQNTALTQRAVSAWVAWPTAVLSVAGVLGGGWLVAAGEGEGGAFAAPSREESLAEAGGLHETADQENES
jgi:hypothetical protein